MFDRSRYRAKSIGVRVAETDFLRLQALADSESRPLSEWCREVLLERANSRDNSRGREATVLAEVLGLRTILLNLFYALGRGQEITGEEMREIIARADTEKLKKAWDRLEGTVAGEPEASA